MSSTYERGRVDIGRKKSAGGKVREKNRTVSKESLSDERVGRET